VPPFDRANVDGFALHAAETAGASDAAPRRLRLNGEVIVCGHAPALTVSPGTATTIATGGVIPRGADAVMIKASDIRPFTRGSGRTERTIHNILMEDRPAESLLVTEVLTPAGNWSSYPPHKHDTDDPPRETYLEETYYHRTARPDGFAVQLVYTHDRSLDEAIQVHDGDVVLVPRGYHPVAAGPGYDLYYLNVMAGPTRRWLVTTDPDHRWQLD